MRRSLADGVKAMASFDVRTPIVVGLALHWSWIWLVFWSSLFYNAWPDRLGFLPSALPLETLWVLSLLANFIAAALAGLASRRLGTLGARVSLPIVAALLTSLGTFFVAQPNHLFAVDFAIIGYSIGSLITGLGSAMLFVLWGELLTILGARQTVIYNVAAIILGSVLYFLLLLPDPQFARNAVAVFPIISMMMFCESRGVSEKFHERQTKGTPRKAFDSPDDPSAGILPNIAAEGTRRDILSLVILSLFFGLSYGLMKGLLVHENTMFIAFRDGLNVISFAAGALVALSTMSMFKMDFGSMAYQIALPLMAAGFLLLTFDGYLKLAGFTLHQIGYQYFYAIIWALWPVLAKKNPQVPIAFFSCVSIASMQGGQFFGSVAGTYIFQIAAGNGVVVNQASSFAIFVILLVALFGFGSSRSNWGLVRPMGGNSSTDKLEITCGQIANTRGLSPRETEVFLLLAKGRNADYICSKLVISKPTVKTHIKNIYRKLEIHSQQALLDMVELENGAESKL